MIHIDRHAVDVPAPLLADRVAAALSRARAHFAKAGPEVEQRTYSFDRNYHDDRVGVALGELFHDKCAFCESRVGASQPRVAHHFRPKQEAVDLEGDVSRPHYWWLAYEWDNLYLACQRCAASAGRRFPVVGERAAVESSVVGEERLLIDPCADEPSEYLVFDELGWVSPRDGADRMAPVTIDTFALNRRGLVEARRMAITEALSAVRTRLAAGAVLIESLVLPGREHAGAVRQAVFRLLDAEGLPQLRLERTSAEVISRDETDRAVVRERARPVEPVGVEWIAIRDLRAIEDLTLELVDPRSRSKAPWTMLIAENGHGKSTVLQAIALPLMGDRARDALGLRPDGLIRHGADVASVTVGLRGSSRTRRLEIHRDGFLDAGPDDLPAAIAAYGAARIPTDDGRAASPSASEPRVRNLFKPGSALIAATQWLLNADERTFNFAARALRELTLEDEQTVFERHPDAVVLRRAGRPPVSLEQLSDGYRSIVALAVDLMSYFTTRYRSMDDARGIVLIDEISAHLHPRWQMRVVEVLRGAFPRLQFVATTHDPLSLRGMENDRVVVLRRTPSDRRIYALPQEEVPPVGGIRVDALLTSPVFGLSSTVDPKVEAVFDAYYEALAVPVTDQDPELLARLRAQLAQYDQRGTTHRERLAYDAIDAWLAQERDLPDPIQRRERLGELNAQLQAIWADGTERDG